MTDPDEAGAPGPGPHERGSGGGARPAPEQAGPARTDPAGTEQEETLESLFGLSAPAVRPARAAPE